MTTDAASGTPPVPTARLACYNFLPSFTKYDKFREVLCDTDQQKHRAFLRNVVGAVRWKCEIEEWSGVLCPFFLGFLEHKTASIIRATWM